MKEFFSNYLYFSPKSTQNIEQKENILDFSVWRMVIIRWNKYHSCLSSGRTDGVLFHLCAIGAAMVFHKHTFFQVHNKQVGLA